MRARGLNDLPSPSGSGGTGNSAFGRFPFHASAEPGIAPDAVGMLLLLLVVVKVIILLELSMSLRDARCTLDLIFDLSPGASSFSGTFVMHKGPIFWGEREREIKG